MGQVYAVIRLNTAISGRIISLEAFKGIDVLDENGEWTGEVIEVPGSRRQIGWENKNQILKSGKNIMATSSGWAGLGSKAQVGTNSTLPTEDHTQLLGYVAGTAVIYDHDSGAQGSAPYFGWDLTTYRFGAGEATGVLREAGVGWDEAEGAFLVSRSLIVDDLGDPTDATVLADEYLDLKYQFQYHPPPLDSTGTIELDGVTYDYIARAALVTSWGWAIGQAIGQVSDTTSDWRAFDGDLGDITTGPDGLSAPCDNANQYNLGYSNNSYQIDMVCDCGPGTGVGNAWNLALGMRSLQFKTTTGYYQIQFNAQGTGARIPKTVDKRMIAWTFRLGWEAAP